jgi:hypothetical protein
MDHKRLKVLLAVVATLLVFSPGYAAELRSQAQPAAPRPLVTPVRPVTLPKAAGQQARYQLRISRLFLKDNSLQVGIVNLGPEPLPTAGFAQTRLQVSYPGMVRSWTLGQFDPTRRQLARPGQEMLVDTGLVLDRTQRVHASLDAFPGAVLDMTLTPRGASPPATVSSLQQRAINPQPEPPGRLGRSIVVPATAGSIPGAAGISGDPKPSVALATYARMHSREWSGIDFIGTPLAPIRHSRELFGIDFIGAPLTPVRHSRVVADVDFTGTAVETGSLLDVSAGSGVFVQRLAPTTSLQASPGAVRSRTFTGVNFTGFAAADKMHSRAFFGVDFQGTHTLPPVHSRSITEVNFIGIPD